MLGQAISHCRVAEKLDEAIHSGLSQRGPRRNPSIAHFKLSRSLDTMSQTRSRSTPR